jgi:23S rRNA (guanosine2251-2'-O)-methyltransferase
MTTKKTREQELIYGIHPIIEVLKTKRRKLYTLYTTSKKPEAFSIISPLLAPYTQIQLVDREKLAKMAGTNEHQGFVAAVEPYHYRKKPFSAQLEPSLLFLDSLQDPRNVGAIIRSAACIGFNGVIITTKHSSPLSGTVHKSAAGLTERIEVMQCSSSAIMLETLKKSGYSIYLATIEGRPLQEATFKKPLCLVIGNEATGINKSLYQFGEQVSLPQKNPDISFNASVAAGIFLFYIANQ